MANKNIKLTSAEIGALWTAYNECSSTNCFYKHFLIHLTDQAIKPIIEEAQLINDRLIQYMEDIFTEENFPIPKAFSDDDVDFTAPALFTDLYALSFVYRESRMMNIFYGTMLGKVAREDILNFMEDGLYSSIRIYKNP
ncbi:DUF3231 family protein [Virgibacillus oceani]|uniref:DUF3231 family protein n=1 Tax=Virgibacillus oceani TaxID=1479511 RepID=A0A917H8H4_9BACI|nr:DUF3231 family protein [Virgibacillus oceani]GGG70565.1 hypothetical protein GCM10011398_13370 [Virgibacillus oceani]